jgi:hypothetical protein
MSSVIETSNTLGESVKITLDGRWVTLTGGASATYECGSSKEAKSFFRNTVRTWKAAERLRRGRS